MWIASVTLEIKAITRTWRESGDWVALHNITNRGSTHISPRMFQVYENETLKLADEICIFLYTAVKDLLKQNFKASR